MPASSPSSWSLRKPTRAVPVNDPTLPVGWPRVMGRWWKWIGAAVTTGAVVSGEISPSY
ncbi:hypothetical protein [Streptomyces sp. NPDC001652]|uniref:hypothetical protein n=1 Tax=Streptomyces sp. NPDC001652 TaxID=3154393 RepID=UPI003333F2C9